MSYLKKTGTFLLVVLILIFFSGCSAKQDETNFKKYMSQDTRVNGKAGILISALGQPEEYDFEFYNNYLQLIFNSAFPPILKFIILRDSGTVLRDPENLWAEEEFKRLVQGTPYEKKIIQIMKWVDISRDAISQKEMNDSRDTVGFKFLQ